MIEIIKRNEGYKSQKEQINGVNLQISYNDWGHIAVRVIEDEGKDTLVVFDSSTSRRIINFLKQNDPPF